MALKNLKELAALRMSEKCNVCKNNNNIARYITACNIKDGVIIAGSIIEFRICESCIEKSEDGRSLWVGVRQDGFDLTWISGS